MTLSKAKGSDLTRTNSMKPAENGPRLSKARWMNLQDKRHGTLCSDTIAGGFWFWALASFKVSTYWPSNMPNLIYLFWDY